jgi:hypothetical protein
MRVIRLIKDAARDGRGASLLQLLTPQRAEGRGPITRALMTGATAGVMALGLVLALQATALLLAALGLIYFLMTQVLGIKLDVDPRLVVQQAGQKASSSVLN